MHATYVQEIGEKFLPEVSKFLGEGTEIYIGRKEEQGDDEPDPSRRDIGFIRRESENNTEKRVWIYAEQFPGCCGIAILHDISYDIYPIKPEPLTPIMLRFAEEVAAEAGYSELRATSIENQEAWIAALEASGWKTFKRTFENARTGNEVTSWYKEIEPNEDNL